LEALWQLPGSEDIQRQRVETILRLVQASWMTAGVEQTLERLAEAEERAQMLHGRRQLALVHYWTGLFSSMRNTTPQTLAYSQHVLEEAQKLGDEELITEGIRNWMCDLCPSARKSNRNQRHGAGLRRTEEPSNRAKRRDPGGCSKGGAFLAALVVSVLMRRRISRKTTLS
jgi:hypothetical protein